MTWEWIVFTTVICLYIVGMRYVKVLEIRATGAARSIAEIISGKE